jgi:hypothetical protein
MKITFKLARSKLQETDEKKSYNHPHFCNENRVITKT